MMRDSGSADTPAEALWEARGPLAANVLAPLAEINELALELLAARVAQAEAAALPAFLAESRELWLALGASARRRIASCPFLLVDIGFAEAQRWRQGAIDGVADNVREPSPFDESELPRLAYLSLTYAWHLARTRPLATHLVLGLPAASATLLAEMSIRRLGECLARSAAWIRPRWAHDVGFWRHLLVSATAPEPLMFETARLRGVQLIAGAFVAPPANPRR